MKKIISIAITIALFFNTSLLYSYPDFNNKDTLRVPLGESQERMRKAMEILGRELYEEVKDDIEEAHEVGEGRPYSYEEIKEKVRILKRKVDPETEKPLIDRDKRRRLFEQGVVGKKGEEQIAALEQKIATILSRRGLADTEEIAENIAYEMYEFSIALAELTHSDNVSHLPRQLETLELMNKLENFFRATYYAWYRDSSYIFEMGTTVEDIQNLLLSLLSLEKIDTEAAITFSYLPENQGAVLAYDASREVGAMTILLRSKESLLLSEKTLTLEECREYQRVAKLFYNEINSIAGRSGSLRGAIFVLIQILQDHGRTDLVERLHILLEDYNKIVPSNQASRIAMHMFSSRKLHMELKRPETARFWGGWIQELRSIISAYAHGFALLKEGVEQILQESIDVRLSHEEQEMVDKVSEGLMDVTNHVEGVRKNITTVSMQGAALETQFASAEPGLPREGPSAHTKGRPMDDRTEPAPVASEEEALGMMDKYDRARAAKSYLLKPISYDSQTNLLFIEPFGDTSLYRLIKEGNLSQRQLLMVLLETARGIQALQQDGLEHGNLDSKSVVVHTIDSENRAVKLMNYYSLYPSDDIRELGKLLFFIVYREAYGEDIHLVHPVEAEAEIEQYIKSRDPIQASLNALIQNSGAVLPEESVGYSIDEFVRELKRVTLLVVQREAELRQVSEAGGLAEGDTPATSPPPRYMEGRDSPEQVLADLRKVQKVTASPDEIGMLTGKFKELIEKGRLSDYILGLRQRAEEYQETAPQFVVLIDKAIEDITARALLEILEEKAKILEEQARILEDPEEILEEKTGKIYCYISDGDKRLSTSDLSAVGTLLRLGWLRFDDSFPATKDLPHEIDLHIEFTLVPVEERKSNIVAFHSDVLKHLFEPSGEFVQERLDEFKETVKPLLKPNTIMGYLYPPCLVFIVGLGQKEGLKAKVERLRRELEVDKLFIVALEDRFVVNQFNGLLRGKWLPFSDFSQLIYDFSQLTKASDVIANRQLIQALATAK